MVDIDGSILEGGGQILRMGISLSVLKSTAVNVSKIRAGRSKPGLAAQHMTGIKLARDQSSAYTSGVEIGSTEIKFKPIKLLGGAYEADIKTAGSICLLLQVALPCALFAPSPTLLTLRGGTNAEMAPQIDYTLNVFKPILKKFGADFTCNIIQRGFFPVGKGIVKIEVTPVQKLKPIKMDDFGEVAEVIGEAFVAGVVPFKVAEEMAKAAIQRIRHKLPNTSIKITPIKFSNQEAFGNGSGINMHARTTTGCIFGGSALGNRKTRSDEISFKAADELLQVIDKKCCVDQYLQDQLIIFMALADGKSVVLTGPITLHTKTAIHIAELLTSAKFKIVQHENDMNVIECEGVGHIHHPCQDEL